MVWPINFDHKLQLQTVKDGLKAKKIKLPKMIFFLEKQLIKFSCTYGPLSFCKFLKKFLELIPRVMRMCHFRAQNGPFVMNKFFLVQTIIITFIYLLALFTVQNLKKFLQQIQSYEDAPFLDPKWSIYSKQTFFWKIINIILIFLSAPFTVQNF